MKRGWEGARGGCGLEVCGCGVGARKISQIPMGRVESFAGSGQKRTKISTRAGF